MRRQTLIIILIFIIHVPAQVYGREDLKIQENLTSLENPENQTSQKNLENRKNCIKTYDAGFIDWTTGRIWAVGKASPHDNPDAVSGAARADATKKLIKLLKGIKLNGKTCVGESPSTSDTILAGIEKTAMDAETISQHFTSDGAMEVQLETSMRGGFLQLILPEEIGEIPTITQVDKPAEKKGSPPYTGMILDARGLDFQPVIYPSILSETGERIYGTASLGREFAVQQGICAYVCSPDHPIIQKRAGSTPMTIKVLRRGGQENPLALVISRADGEKVDKAFEHHAFMKECRVVIVMDP